MDYKLSRFSVAALAAALVVAALTRSASAADEESNPKIDLADGKILLTAPEAWVRKTPRVRFIEHEFAVPASKGDTEDGRVTVMGAGGTVEANLDRWIAQFSQPDGSDTKNLVPEADRKKTIAGVEVHFIDLTGTYKDMPRPFDPNGGANYLRSSGPLHLWNPNQPKPATPWEAEIDKLLEQGAAEMDIQKRVPHYWRIQEIMHDQLPVIQTVRQIRYAAYKNTLTNYQPTPLGLYRSEYIEFK